MSHSNQAASTAQILANLLRTEINRGRWADGEALRQEELAAEYKVSRIPIREALAQLHAEGLVCMEPNRGARVATLSSAEIEEIFELRITLESQALAKATPHHTDRSLRDLSRWLEDMGLETEPVARIATDRAFYEGLYAPAAKPRLLGLIRQLRTPIERYCLRAIPVDALGANGPNPSNDQLVFMLKALVARDTSSAVNHLQLYLRAIGDSIAQALQRGA